jgi:predicted thioesterase
VKNTLAAGINATREFVVDRERTIDFMGDEARVYATPMLVRDIEVTCRELLLAHLDPGEDSVGTRIELDHLAPSLLGAKVVLSVRAAEVKGRAVTFELGGATATRRSAAAGTPASWSTSSRPRSASGSKQAKAA